VLPGWALDQSAAGLQSRRPLGQPVHILDPGCASKAMREVKAYHSIVCATKRIWEALISRRRQGGRQTNPRRHSNPGDRLWQPVHILDPGCASKAMREVKAITALFALLNEYGKR